MCTSPAAKATFEPTRYGFHANAANTGRISDTLYLRILAIGPVLSFQHDGGRSEGAGQDLRAVQRGNMWRPLLPRVIFKISLH